MKPLAPLLALLLLGCATTTEERHDMNAPMIEIPYANLGGRVLSAGQPDADALHAAHEAGYTTVINLRPEGEFEDFDERALVESLGMAYRHIPVAGRAGVTEGNARALQAAIAEAGDGPVLVHCGTGNRVGALIALGEWLDGTDEEGAVAEGKRMGLTGLEAVVRELMAQ